MTFTPELIERLRQEHLADMAYHQATGQVRPRNNADNTPISPAPLQAPVQPDNAPSTPVSVALATLSDADLKARCEAAWSHLFAYLNEIRRRAGIVVTDDAIPF